MPEEIEKLIVSVESNVASLVEDLTEGVEDATDELKQMERAGKKATDEVGKGARGLLGIFGNLRTSFVEIHSAIQLATGAVRQFLQPIIQIGQAAIQTNAQFETFSTQFETLLGSADAAQERLEELAEFGLTTPFELPEIVEASRTLQVFGGTALATGSNLRMIGDIAAGVNQPFQSLAFWIGRMFDALKNGQPFGEAALRLQEMGVLSGDVRRQMEAMQKAGKDGAEIFDFFSEQVGGKFAGNMERLSGTFQGVMSNLIDFRENLIRIGGESFFEGVRDDAKRFLDVISEDQMQEAIFNLAKALGEAAAKAQELLTGGLFDTLEAIEPDTIQDFADAIGRASDSLAKMLDLEFSQDLNGLIDLITTLTNLFTTWTELQNKVNLLGEDTSAIYDAVVEAFDALFNPIQNVINAFDRLNMQIAELTGKELVDWSADAAAGAAALGEEAEKVDNTFNKMQAAVKGAVDANRDLADSADEAAGALDKEAEKLKEILDKLAIDFIDATEDRAEKLEELEQNHAEKVLEMEEEFSERRAEIVEDRADRLADLEESVTEALEDAVEKRAERLEDLEEDIADAREKIFERSREQLAKLERDTDEKLADERADFQEDERRDTEDHLREMRRIRAQALDDLEDAVAARDVRAIRDIQRRFQKEQQEQTDDFNLKQSRERQDQDIRLQRIRENEERRAQEIMMARDRDLRNLEETEEKKRQKIQETFDKEVEQVRENEAKKRLAIEESFQENIAKLDERFLEAQAKEQADFEKRQEALEESLLKRLEATAKNLSDIEDLNGEHGKQLLEILNETFGVGGDIDQLMSDFEKRRTRRLVVKLNFESGGVGRGGGGGADVGGGGGRGGGGSPFVRAFAEGGTLLAQQPTLALFGERGPELVQFTPMSQIGGDSLSMNKTIDMNVAFSGSAPPGIRSQDRDAIAGVMVSALREAGLMRR